MPDIFYLADHSDYADFNEEEKNKSLGIKKAVFRLNQPVYFN